MRENFAPHTEIIEVGESMAKILEKIRSLRIDPLSFKGIKGFNEEKIDRDAAFIARVEEKYTLKAGTFDHTEEKVHAEAKIVETMMPMIIRDFDWLGPDTDIIFTSLYDDVANGIDSVVQFPGEGMESNLGMEVDFASSEAEMMAKILKIGQSLEKGIVSSVEYFDSPSSGKIKGVKMPKIAFGATGKEMGNLAEVVADAYLSPVRKELAQAELRNHAMKKRFISLAANQLKEFGAIAEKAGHGEISRLHRNVLEILKRRKLI
ncbi:MAG: hypothetical protein AAB610_01850 [Patescibacteria group bacterium]